MSTETNVFLTGDRKISLISRKYGNCLVEGVLHVDTWFRDEDGTIYLEEDFVDLADIFSEYGIEVSLLRKEDIQFGKVENEE